MPNEERVIAMFPKCPDCGSEETASHTAFKELIENGKFAPDIYTSLGMEQPVLLEEPVATKVMMPGSQTQVDGIYSYWDICLGCGRKRYTKVAINKVNVVAGGPPTMMSGRGFRQPPQSRHN